MSAKTRIVFLALLTIFATTIIHAQKMQNAAAEVLHVRHVVGMQNAKYDATGLLLIVSKELHFDAGRSRGAVPLSSIEDIYVGSEITEGGGRLGELARGAAMAAPYDSGAALTLLMIQKVDVLTVTYRDSDNGLHAAIFAVPKNHAEKFRAELISSGAHVKNAAKVSRVPAPAEAGRPKSAPASAVMVEPVDSGDVNIPAEFRLAIYEDIVKKLEASGIYARVFRSGDRRADGIAGLEVVADHIGAHQQHVPVLCQASMQDVGALFGRHAGCHGGFGNFLQAELSVQAFLIKGEGFAAVAVEIQVGI